MPIHFAQRFSVHTVAIVLALFVLGSDGFAQTGFAPAYSTTQNQQTIKSEVEQLIFKATQFESKGEWGEALSIYEKAKKQFPNDNSIQQRSKNARIHFTVIRRYKDPSYIKSVRNSTEQATLETLTEVLAKIQSHFVHTPNWKSMIQHGVANMDVALFHPEFQNVCIRNATPQALQNAQRELHQKINSMQLNSRQQAYAAIVESTRVLSRHLSISNPGIIFEFVNGAVNSLDPYSSFLTADQYGEVMSHIEGNFVGLGVEIRPTEEALEIVDVIKGGPASQAGIGSGDKITRIDGKFVTDVGGNAAADMLRGPEGSYVVVSVLKPNNKTLHWKIRRQRVDIPSVEEVRIIEGTDVGYIKLVNFQKTTTRDFDAALWKLHRAGMRSLIVDLRGNPGGLLNASVDLADRFISNGVIVSTKGRNPGEDFIHRARSENTWRVPLVCMIDENSASASEILAGAIKDHRMGTIVGTRSYGKGSVQGIFPLNHSRGGVRLTTAKFYSPLGTAISNRGVSPEVTIQKVAKPAMDLNVNNTIQKLSKDSSLKTAVKVAQDKVAQAQARLQANAR